MNDNKDIDPYVILNVTKDYDLDVLKKKFKHLAKIHHPDKGGDKDIFDIISMCFKKLYSDYKLKQNDKQFNEMKQNFKEEVNTTSYTNTNEDFMKKFNQAYDENKLHNPYLDSGYETFIAEKEVKTTKNNYMVSKYKEPDGIQSSLSYYELGVNSVDDYSGNNVDNHKLQYTDYKHAHTTSKLIDENALIKRKDYKSLKDLEIKRKNETFEMSKTDKKYYEAILKKEKQKEDERINNLQIYDNKWEDKYKHTKTLFIS
jgi:curved DNA-binding protein CbpA